MLDGWMDGWLNGWKLTSFQNLSLMPSLPFLHLVSFCWSHLYCSSLLFSVSVCWSVSLSHTHTLTHQKVLHSRSMILSILCFPISWHRRVTICGNKRNCPHLRGAVKEIQPVHPKGDQSWVFIGRIDAKAKTPVLWPPHEKSWLIGKDSDAGRDWRQEEKGTTEDEMAGWHHRLDAREFEWTPGVGDGLGGLACCSPWGRKESDTTELLNWTELNWRGAVLQESCRGQHEAIYVYCLLVPVFSVSRLVSDGAEL